MKVTNLTHPLQDKYNELKSRVCEGSAGKTVQFWIIYLDMMQTQHMAHTSIHENNFHLGLQSQRSFLPWYFAWVCTTMQDMAVTMLKF